MDLTLSAEDERFRDEARTWLEEHIPRESAPRDGKALREFDTAWQAVQYEGGWAGISWPKEYGGRGLSLVQQMIWHEEYARAGGPDVGTNFVGLNDAGPTLIAHGSTAQKRMHLSRILRGEAVWAQGYSEPEAGSDLASLSTRGIVDGDDIVVTGEKVWTSYADVADHQELLVRTNPEAPKHKGITWLICDLDAPHEGIHIEPITMLSGFDRLCRVVYDEVRVPLTNVVGGLDNGWGVLSSSLYLKRGTGRVADQLRLGHRVNSLLELWADRSSHDEHMGMELATAQAEVAALRAMTLAECSRVEKDGHPGAEGSLGRIFHAVLSQRVHRLALELLGSSALEVGRSIGGEDWTTEFLWSQTETVGGGTADVQRNAVAERLLGLPRDR